MDYKPPPINERITIHPGGRWAGMGTHVVSTLLGSCVAACLYDPKARVAGMNHFLLANRRYARNIPVNFSEAGRYGINAMELLVNDMLKLGADKRRLQAKVFGAGIILDRKEGDSFSCVGEVNQRFIREYLSAEGIPLVKEDLGGSLGRWIYFHTDTYTVYRAFIPRTAEVEVEREEREFWTESIQEHEKEKEGGIFLFR